MIRLIARAVTVAIVAAVVVPTAAQEPFPETRQVGRATVEYKGERIKMVASYDYSQRNHDSPWLLIDLAASAPQRLILHRDHITLVTPDGTELGVASQRDLLAGSPQVTLLLQNAKISRRQLDSYFSQREREPLNFFAFPGNGIVHDDAVVDNDRVTLGELFFAEPAGTWRRGTYRLAIRNERARASLPIILQ